MRIGEVAARAGLTPIPDLINETPAPGRGFCFQGIELQEEKISESALDSQMIIVIINATGREISR